MDSVFSFFKNNIRQYAMMIALAAIMILFEILTGGILLKPQNVTNLILQNSYVIILAIGMMLCILSGGNIDLSVGSLTAFTGALAGVLIVTLKLNFFLVVPILLVVGLLAGIFQGFWIAYIRIPPFIVTLAGFLYFRGLTLAILKGETISPFPPEFLVISSGFIPDLFGGPPSLNLFTLFIGAATAAIFVILELRKRANRQKYGFDVLPVPFLIIQITIVILIIGFLSYSLAAYKGIPVILILLAILTIIYTFVTTKTVPGRYIYAMGGNEKAARLSGINTNKVLFFTYVNMAVLTAITGIVFTARLQAAVPSAGTNFELDAIAACFIGGASATGGIGTVVGAITGAFVMGVLNNGMSILGLGSDWQLTIKGFVLLLAVAFDVMSKNRSKT